MKKAQFKRKREMPPQLVGIFADAVALDHCHEPCMSV